MAKAESTPIKKKTRMGKKTRYIFSWFLQTILALVLAAFVAYGFFGTVIMQENSMEPTIHANDHVRVNRIAYLTGTPEREDVIAFYKSDSRTGSIQIKRVIGLPGDKVQIKDGVILINGEIYEESEQYTKMNNAGLAADEITLKKGEYFVLGDNRNNSEDSRFIDMGNIKEENIIGKVWVLTSPWSRFTFL